jgi:hypothetical protein
MGNSRKQQRGQIYLHLCPQNGVRDCQLRDGNIRVLALLEVLSTTSASTHVLALVVKRTSSKSVEQRFLGKHWYAGTRAY